MKANGCGVVRLEIARSMQIVGAEPFLCSHCMAIVCLGLRAIELFMGTLNWWFRYAFSLELEPPRLQTSHQATPGDGPDVECKEAPTPAPETWSQERGARGARSHNSISRACDPERTGADRTLRLVFVWPSGMSSVRSFAEHSFQTARQNLPFKQLGGLCWHVCRQAGNGWHICVA